MVKNFQNKFGESGTKKLVIQDWRNTLMMRKIVMSLTIMSMESLVSNN